MASSDNRYDFWINGLGFNTYITKDHPYERSTADYRKEQFNSAAGTGDTALTGWWTQGQLSFHGGEALRYDSEWTPITDIRFDTGSNLDCYTAGYAKVGLATAAVTTLHTTYNSMSVMPSAGLLVARGPAGTLDVIDQGGTGTDNKTFSEFPVPGGTPTTHPGIAGDATAYVVTDNTIERCWHQTPPTGSIKQWSTNPALAGSSVILPFAANSNGQVLKTGGLSGGAAITVASPNATTIYNLCTNPSLAAQSNNPGALFGPWTVAQTGGTPTIVPSTVTASGISTVASNSPLGTMPTSTTAGFVETVAPSAVNPYVISIPFSLRATGAGTAILNFSCQTACNDSTLTGGSAALTVSVVWDVGGTTTAAGSVSAGPAWTSNPNGTFAAPGLNYSTYNSAITVPSGATTGTLQLSYLPAGGTHTAGKGIYLTDVMLSTDTAPPTFFSGTYAPTGMTAAWIGQQLFPNGTSVASMTPAEQEVMVTVRATGYVAALVRVGGAWELLPPLTKQGVTEFTGSYQSWVSGGVTTLAIPMKTTAGLVQLALAASSVQVVSVTDVLKPALVDSTTAYSSTNWTWDGATNASTQTFSGNYFSEPLAWLPTLTTAQLLPGQFAPLFVGAWFAKGRLIALDNTGNWYQASPSSRHILGTADIFWTVPIEIANTSIPWSVHEGPDGIYIAHDHRIWLASLDTTSTSAPTVAQVAAVANDEVIKDFAYYLGQLITVTDKGIRSGRLNLYGRLIIGPRFALGSYTACTPWDDTVLVSGTESVTGVSGVFAVSMVVDVDQNTTIPAWWNVWQGTPPLSLGASVGSPSASWNPDGGFTTRPSFNAPVALSATGTVNTFAANSAASGSLTTTRIRMGTLENKVFRYLTVRTSGTSGTVAVSVILPNGTTISLGSVTAGNIGTWDLQAQSGFPAQGCEYVQFQFTISGAASLTGWQIKAQPNPTRQRMIKVPLQLFDTETSIYGATSYQSAAKRLLALEALENSNAVVTYKDTTTGDSGTAYIESIQVVRLAPASAQANGGTPSFGGTIELTLRKA